MKKILFILLFTSLFYSCGTTQWAALVRPYPVIHNDKSYIAGVLRADCFHTATFELINIETEKIVRLPIGNRDIALYGLQPGRYVFHKFEGSYVASTNYTIIYKLPIPDIFKDKILNLTPGKVYLLGDFSIEPSNNNQNQFTFNFSETVSPEDEEFLKKRYQVTPDENLFTPEKPNKVEDTI